MQTGSSFARTGSPPANIGDPLAAQRRSTIPGITFRFWPDLLTRGITYKLQERAYGGLSTATARKLEQAGAVSLSRGSVAPVPPISLRPGTRLVREWRGVTHMVLIHADGIEWRGQRYRSLSLVARKITGARWSDPRFFGLRQRPLDSTSSARAGHGQG